MDAELRKFLEEEVLVECRQRIGDLQQRLLLKINGTASSDILMKTNKELIRGVDRALFVTVDALNIVVAIALALTNQKLVLRSLDALNETTNKLLVSASELMQKQAAVILEQGAKGMLSQKALEQVFVNIFDTFDQISRFKQQALPEMSIWLTNTAFGLGAERNDSSAWRGVRKQIIKMTHWRSLIQAFWTGRNNHPTCRYIKEKGVKPKVRFRFNNRGGGVTYCPLSHLVVNTTTDEPSPHRLLVGEMGGSLTTQRKGT